MIHSQKPAPRDYQPQTFIGKSTNSTKKYLSPKSERKLVVEKSHIGIQVLIQDGVFDPTKAGRGLAVKILFSSGLSVTAFFQIHTDSSLQRA